MDKDWNNLISQFHKLGGVAENVCQKDPKNMPKWMPKSVNGSKTLGLGPRVHDAKSMRGGLCALRKERYRSCDGDVLDAGRVACAASRALQIST